MKIHIKIITEDGIEKTVWIKGFADDIFIGDILNIDDKSCRVTDKWNNIAE